MPEDTRRRRRPLNNQRRHFGEQTSHSSISKKSTDITASRRRSHSDNSSRSRSSSSSSSASYSSLEAALSECRECSVVLNRLDCEQILRNQRSSPESDTYSDISDNRLGKKENGMVHLPRTHYNKHPARVIIGERRNSSTADGLAFKKRIRKKRSDPDASESDNPEELHDDLEESHDSPEELHDGPEESHDGFEVTYKLMFLNPTDSNMEKRPDDFTLRNISESIDVNGLPSGRWEIERIPPIMEYHGKSDNSYDVIAAELEAIMGEKKPDTEPETIEHNTNFIKPVENELLSSEKNQNIEVIIENNINSIQVIQSQSDIEKEKDEYPSIMDILNEPAEPIETDSTIKSDSVSKLDIEMESEDNKQSSGLELENVIVLKQNINNNEGYILKNIIFRRLTDDKQTYDRLVTFNADMEYSVAINDEKVELIGAPVYIASIDDLKILLQIVNDLDPNSSSVYSKVL